MLRPMRLEDAGSFFSTLLLIVCGAIGVVIGVAGMFGIELERISADSLTIVIALVGLIALSLGVERAIEQRKLSLQIERLEASLASRVGGRVLSGYRDMEAAAIRSVRHARSWVRIVVHASSLEARNAFTDALAERLRESRLAGNPISAEILYIVDPSLSPADFAASIGARFARYASLGISDQFRLRMLQSSDPTGVELLLVDENDSFLFFPVLHGTADIQRGLLFEHQPTICHDLIAWFEQRVKDGSEDLRALLRQSPTAIGRSGSTIHSLQEPG